MRKCPFCGNDNEKKPFIKRFKKARKIHGIQYILCILQCGGCTCTISQAGPTKEIAEQYVKDIWNGCFLKNEE